MPRYLAGRLAQALFVVWAAFTAAFLVLFALPGDAVSLLAGGDASDVTADQENALRARLGLDAPLWLQYLTRLAGFVTGSPGASFVTGRPVADIVGEALGPTLQVSALALVIAFAGGTALAVAANLARDRRLANLLASLPPLGVAVPAFWFGLVLIQWFSFEWRLLPAMGDRTAAALVLPALTMALPTGATIAQLLTKSLATTLREPFVDTVRAKGAGDRLVVVGHALRNAALPALTMGGLVVGQLLSGAVVTETVFGRPGLGRVAADAVEGRDLPVVLCVVVLAAAAFALTNLVVDLLYPLLDPRIAHTRLRTPVRAATTTGVPA